MKKLLSVILAVMMLASIMTTALIAYGDEGFNATLGFANSDWSVQEWGDAANTTVNGAGEYTLSWDLPEGTTVADALVFVIDVAGAGSKGYKLTDLAITADGNEVAVDLSKVKTGDLEDNGNFRIEIYNEYGSTKENAPINNTAFTVEKNLTIAFTLEEESYQATLGFANSDWSVQEWGDNASVKVAGAGEYTLSWDLPEGTTISDALVFVVDVVGGGAKGYKLTGLTITADGNDVAVDMDKVKTGDLEEKGNFRIEIYNEYGSTKDDAPIDYAALTVEKNLTIAFTVDVEEVAVVLEPREVKLGYTNSEWSVSEWGDNVNTTVEGAGEYTLSWDLPEGSAVEDALVFVVDVVGGGNDGYELTDLTVTADGNEVAVDMTKVQTGDLEEKGNFRIEIYNEYGPTAADAPIDTALAFEKNLTVNFTLSVSDSAAEGESEPKPVFDPSASYNAYLGVQTPNWTYRDAWNSNNGIGSEHWGDFIFGNETGEKYGVVTDTVVAGNGTYTVSVTDFGTIFADDFQAAGQEWFNLLYVSTDIPLSETIKITDVTLIIDGKAVHKYAEYYQNPDDTKYVSIQVQNIWNADIKEISYYPAPTTSLEITFTISGFDYDA